MTMGNSTLYFLFAQAFSGDACMPLKKHLLSSPKKTRLLLCLPEDAWGHLQKGQSQSIGSLTSTPLRLLGAGLAGRHSLSAPQFRAAEVPLQHDLFPW